MGVVIAGSCAVCIAAALVVAIRIVRDVGRLRNR